MMRFHWGTGMVRKILSWGCEIALIPVKLIFLLVFLLFFPLFILLVVLAIINRPLTYLLVWILWLPKGRDVLVVLSDNPIWRDYMLSEIVPLVGQRAVVLNWSERRIWPRRSLATSVFYSFCGEHNYNPMVIVFRPWRRAAVFRFWSPFQEWKHGHKQSVDGLRQRLVATL